MTKSDNKDSIYLFYANPILIDNDKLLVRSPFMYIFGNDFHPIMESVASVFQKNFWVMKRGYFYDFRSVISPWLASVMALHCP